MAGFLFRRLFGALTGIAVQNEEDARRLQELGCRPEAIQVVGNLKYDTAKLDERRVLDVPAMLKQVGVRNGAPIIVAGSTHDGEETVIARQYRRLKQEFPDLFLVLVPRHVEFSREVGRRLGTEGIKFAYRSELTASTEYKPGELDCLLVNSTGELKFFYEHATVVFIGKSLTAKGGQNPIEPAAIGKPVVFGPNMSEFADIVRNFLAADGAWQVPDEAGLGHAFETLLRDPARREQLGRNAATVVQQNVGSVERTVEMIVQHLEGGELYVAPR